MGSVGRVDRDQLAKQIADRLMQASPEVAEAILRANPSRDVELLALLDEVGAAAASLGIDPQDLCDG